MLESWIVNHAKQPLYCVLLFTLRILEDEICNRLSNLDRAVLLNIQ